jgi:hypothetical protein
MASAANWRNSGGASPLATDVVSVGRARSGDRLLPGQQFASGARDTDRCRQTATGVRLGAEIGLGEGYRSWRAGANDNVGLRHFGSLHARLCFAAEKDRQVDAVRRLRPSPAQFLPRRPGKVVEVDGVPVTAVNANAGSETRNHFLPCIPQSGRGSIHRVLDGTSVHRRGCVWRGAAALRKNIQRRSLCPKPSKRRKNCA